jgi:hypothetical protein
MIEEGTGRKGKREEINEGKEVIIKGTRLSEAV